MEIQICSNKGAGPFWGKIRKNLINLKKSSSHEPLAGMNPCPMNYLANFNQTWWETCLRDGDSDLFIKRGWRSLLGPNKGQNKENVDKSLKNLLLMNCWPECINIGHGVSLGQGDSSLFKISPWGNKRPRPKGT